MYNEIEEPGIAATDWMLALLPLLEEGHELRITPQGGSMAPFLVGGRDEAILVTTTGKKLKRRDIVLYALPDGIHVLHRVHHVSKCGIYTLGDFQTEVEGPYEQSQMLAVTKAIVRKGKTISCDSRAYNLLSELWLRMRYLRRPIVYFCRRIKT